MRDGSGTMYKFVGSPFLSCGQGSLCWHGPGMDFARKIAREEVEMMVESECFFGLSQRILAPRHRSLYPDSGFVLHNV